MNSFFDFDLIPNLENDKDYESQYDSESNSESSNDRPLRKKYYYYFKKDGPRYLFDPDNPSKKQVVTPGTHYKPENDDKEVTENSSTESKPVLNQAVVGPYQVSVVDADSPVLSNLGLNKEDLMKLSGHTKRSTTNASMVGSGSVPAATYAETPRQEHPPPNYHSHPPPPYEPSDSYGPDRSYRPPSDYYPAENPAPHRGYSSGQPPPQGSYDPKSYPPPHSPPSYNYPPQSSPQRSYSPYPPSYAPKRSSEVPWRQVSSSHTDWDDKQNKKPEPYHGYSHYQPPPAHSPKPSYGSSSEKTGYRYSSYNKPTYSSPSSGSSEYHSHKHSGGSSSSEYSYRHSSPGSSDYHSHKHSSPSSSEYHSHKPSYPSSSYSSSGKAPPPSRAGSVSYGSSHEASKPGITIRFKKSGHDSGHGGSSGLSIPLNFNPLDVVKKLLPSLNPLNNKKVTIGITIENKNKPYSEYTPY